jgi:hypothetical protein
MPEAEPFFEPSEIHVAMAAWGGSMFIACLLPRIKFLRAASTAAILMIAGLLTF